MCASLIVNSLAGQLCCVTFEKGLTTEDPKPDAVGNCKAKLNDIFGDVRDGEDFGIGELRLEFLVRGSIFNGPLFCNLLKILSTSQIII